MHERLQLITLFKACQYFYAVQRYLRSESMHDHSGNIMPPATTLAEAQVNNPVAVP